ncbi:NAD(P)-dependent alcohol dehydrogenase [Actinoallomurus iriomotensis]|uniref:NADPH:quinone reductase n=1 Tax=Actinoallomurus iriomotensis TaxID=478107 RepID=A0A9W6VTV7_9ACTN|nr:NAD(P)-dependent alcohol dehydrogenase [Actinoallomurus iriomotensis]GLY80135.1 NADPH:quinone reductase [Actinoallomurus iriomotensis]
MKAIVQDRYGAPDVLELTDIAAPEPGEGEVLVRVRAAAVNAADWHVMRGDPYLARLSIGLTRPRARVRGQDFAGQVESVGPDVTRFAPGDEVYGNLSWSEGAFAEYVRAPADRVAAKPARLTYEEAAALPLAGMTALQGLRDAAEVRPGQRVLINGASGGVGLFAVQLGKAFGAEVTGVCRTRNVDLVRSAGADHVIDYTEDDFTRSGRSYDVVFDLVANRSLRDLRRTLAPGGTLVLSGGGVFEGGSLIGPMGLIIRTRAASRFVRDRLIVLMTKSDGAGLAALTELAEAGKITPVVERTYPLAETPAAIRHVETEHARAKVVITV